MILKLREIELSPVKPEVECVARAIASVNHDPDALVSPCRPFTIGRRDYSVMESYTGFYPLWRIFINEAEKAIVAMREPAHDPTT